VTKKGKMEVKAQVPIYREIGGKDLQCNSEGVQQTRRFDPEFLSREGATREKGHGNGRMAVAQSLSRFIGKTDRLGEGVEMLNHPTGKYSH
jgi:hypothetical protein